jgi:hypothetical protein
VAAIEFNQTSESRKRNKWYPWFVWITTILVSGPLSLTLDSIFQEQGLSVLPVLFEPKIILLYLILSTPTFILSLSIFYLLTGKKINALTIKIALTILSILGILTTLALFGGIERSLLIYLIYSLNTIPQIFLFRVYKK